MNGPALLDDIRRPRHPTNPQPGQAIRLGQPARDDRAIVSPPHRRRLDAVHLRAAVNLVRHDPGADTSCGTAIASSSVPEAALPVGLLGLQIAMTFVPAETSSSSAARSGCHRAPPSPPMSGHGRTTAPSPRARPRICM